MVVFEVAYMSLDMYLVCSRKLIDYISSERARISQSEHERWWKDESHEKLSRRM